MELAFEVAQLKRGCDDKRAGVSRNDEMDAVGTSKEDKSLAGKMKRASDGSRADGRASH